MFLNIESILHNFLNKKVYIYGAGADAGELYNQVKDYIEVIGFIETKKTKESYMSCQVFSFEDVKDKEVPIIIASGKYYSEINAYLIEMGMKPEKDFWVWDKYSFYNTEGAIDDLIEWNKDNFTFELCGDKSNNILIPIENGHDSIVIFYAYVCEYLRKKYNAIIECYKRRNNMVIAPTIVSIYESFGVKEIVDERLSLSQETEAKRIRDEIWDTINDFSDWKNITVYGIRFGTTIIRDYLRFEEPLLDPKDIKLKTFLLKSIETIVFWYNQILTKKYKVVVLKDGAHWEGYIRDIAISMNIPVYAMEYKHSFRTYKDFSPAGKHYIHYRRFWDELSEVEKEYGLKWAEKCLNQRFSGEDDHSKELIMTLNPFASTMGDDERVLEKNDKIKVLIAVHILDEDCCIFGNQIFDDNYISWLVHLGELSEKYVQYDWYIKAHPHGGERDKKLIKELLERFPKIKQIPTMTSGVQLSKEGLDYVLTVHGTVGLEYPLLGIQVITAGMNRFQASDFTWNPKTKEEYDEMISNLGIMNNLDNKNDVYKFYAIQYLYYKHESRSGIPFFDGFERNEIGMWNDDFIRKGIEKRADKWKYKLFMEEINSEKHKLLQNRIIEIFDEIDGWREDVFYKRDDKCHLRKNECVN